MNPSALADDVVTCLLVFLVLLLALSLVAVIRTPPPAVGAGRLVLTQGARTELDRIGEEFQRQLVAEAASKGPVTKRSVRAAARKLQRGTRKQRKARKQRKSQRNPWWILLGGLGTAGSIMVPEYAPPHTPAREVGVLASVLLIGAGCAGQFFSERIKSNPS
jgi:hypothetical protein